MNTKINDNIEIIDVQEDVNNDLKVVTEIWTYTNKRTTVKQHYKLSTGEYLGAGK